MGHIHAKRVLGAAVLVGSVAVVVLGLGASAEHEPCITTVTTGGNIQENITAAADGAVICVDDGTFEESLTVNKTDLVLQNTNASSFPVLQNTTDLDVGIEVVNASVTVEGIDVTGFNHTGIFVNASSGVTIQDLNVSSIATSGGTDLDRHGILVKGSPDVVISNVTAFGNERRGISVEALSDRILIEDSRFVDNGWQGIVVSADDATVRSNTVTGNSFNVAAEGVEISFALNAVVEGNNVSANDGKGIEVRESSDDAEIRGNDVSGNNRMGIEIRESLRATVDNNTVSNNDDRGIYVLFSSDEATVSNNTVDGSTGDGIEITGSADVLVADNVVTSNGVDGIDINTLDGAVIRDNGVDGNTFDNVFVDGATNVTVTSNEVTNAGDRGIAFVSASHDGVIADNNVSDNTGSAVFVDSSDDVLISGLGATGNGAWVLDVQASSRTRVSDATITANTDRAAMVQNSDNFTLENSFIDDNDRVQIQSTADAFVANNTISNATGTDGDGIQLFQSARALVDNNQMVDNDVQGIEVRDSDDVELRDNAATGNVDGVFAWDGSARLTIRTNDFSSNTRFGIGLDNTPNATLANNTINDNDDRGIEVFTASHDAVISDNTILRNGADAIVIDASDRVAVTGNNASKNLDDGIELDDASNATLANNTVNDNADEGIHAHSASHDVSIADNAVLRAGDNAVRIVDSDRVAVERNNVSESVDDAIILISVPDGLVANNTVLDAGDDGIDLDDGVGVSAGTVVRGNLVNGTAQHGVVVESDDVVIVDNVVRDSGLNGILFETGATNNTVRDTMVTASGLWAFNTTAGGINFAERLDVGASTKADTQLSFEARNASVRGNGSSQPINANAEPLGRYFDAEANDAGAYLHVSVHYTDGDVSGLDESTAAVWRLAGSSWTELASTVDAGANTVTRNITSFSVFGAFADQASTNGGGGTGDEDGPSPDFVVTSATVSVTTTVVGENVTVTATVENRGDASGTEGVAFLMDDGTIRSRSLTLAVGGSGTVSLTHQYDAPRTYDVRVGGVAAGTVTVTAPGGPGQPDIRVTSPTLDPMTVTVGQSAEACGTFENVGDAAGTVTVSVDVDGQTVGTEQVSVAAGGSQTVCRSFSPSEPGDAQVRVNGALAGTLSVQAADDGNGDGDGPAPIPGFGPVLAALALVGVAWVVKRRR